MEWNARKSRSHSQLHTVQPRIKQKAISLHLFNLYPVWNSVTGSGLFFVSSELWQRTELGCNIYGLSWPTKLSLLSECLKQEKILWMSHRIETLTGSIQLDCNYNTLTIISRELPRIIIENELSCPVSSHFPWNVRALWISQPLQLLGKCIMSFQISCSALIRFPSDYKSENKSQSYFVPWYLWIRQSENYMQVTQDL